MKDINTTSKNTEAELLKENEARCVALALEARRLRSQHPPIVSKLEEKPPSIHKAVAPPSISKMVASASKSLTKWVGSGLSQSTQEVIDARLSICKGCELWDAKALNETGRCLKCGCATWAKIRMATERCPIGKWEPVSSAKTDQEFTPEQETTKS